MSTSRTEDATLVLRPWRATDLDAVLKLLEASLGWRSDDPNEALFSWKHRESPFGASPAWVALDEDQVVALRTFMRWQFVIGDRVVEAVRAVDTATHPAYQGRGLFTRLTLHALDELRGTGVDFVFNTPNDQSRPGYLKMGWQVVGRLPTAARPRSLRSLVRMAAARTPAELWSLPCGAGMPAVAAFADASHTGRLVDAVTGDLEPGLRTRLSHAFLSWRYGFPPLHYRVELLGSSLSDGALVFRLRRRGPATELVVADVLAPKLASRSAAAALRRCLHHTGADYAVGLRNRSIPRNGLISLPGQGPVLAWRGVGKTEQPPARSWLLSLGDVELF